VPILENKVVVITGAGRGLGRAYAVAMAKEGARLVINDLKPDLVEAAAEEIRRSGGRAIADSHDIATWDGAHDLVQTALRGFGTLDALVNNAGILHKARLLDESEAGFDAIFRTNTYGTFFCARHAANVLVQKRAGVILNTTSYAQAGGPDLSAYNGSKGAVASLTYSWALELAPYGIRVNALSPSGATQMTDILNAGREKPTVYQPVELAAPLACFLISDYAKNITGQVMRLHRDSLQIHAHPGPWREAKRPQGWTLQDIIRDFPSMLGKDLHPVGAEAASYQFYNALEESS